MDPSARLFHCARCHAQVILWSACDRSHVYCRNGCAAAARRESDFVQIERAALRKLRQLDQARSLDDLRAPPGNRLEALGGDRTGQYNIRINQQWRLCCLWRDGQPHEAEIVDYH